MVDYIIVGKGLAGTTLAHTLLQHKKSVIIIDNPIHSSASRVAAGLFNPVVFKRLTKSWKADTLLPFMDCFYQNMETILGQNFYFKKNILKLFTEDQEKLLWDKKKEKDMAPYLGEHIEEKELNKCIRQVNGAAEIMQSGHLNVAQFLIASEVYFKELNILIEETFDHRQLTHFDKGIHYKTLSSKKIIFCEGYKATENPFFKQLPFKLTKGEVITIECAELAETNRVINKGVFILPVGDHLYKVGATYEWNDLSENITLKGQLELVEKLNRIIHVPYKIVAHEAGIRPTVSHRRPLLGAHPEHPSVLIFNGLGTKGVMLAPYFAQLLYEFMEQGKPLDPEVDIRSI